jgi:peptidoglycan hydrolase-like protein with peptidoglycan-binding domain
MGKHWTAHHAAIFGADTPPTIRKGSKGDIVKEWQFILQVPQDGSFGKGTEAATKNWQMRHGLKADGVVGPTTWSTAHNEIAANQGHVPPNPGAVQEAVAQVAAQSNAPVVPAATTSNVAQPTSGNVPTTIIKRGSKGDAVKQWQGIIGENPDGVFGSGTDKKTKDWQKRHGLKPDGVVGPQTWAIALQGSPPAVVQSVANMVDNGKTTGVVQSADAAIQQAATTSTAAARKAKSLWPWAGVVAAVGGIFYATTHHKG